MNTTAIFRRLASAMLRNPEADQHPRTLACSAQLSLRDTDTALAEWTRLGWLSKNARIFRLTPTGHHELELLLR